MEIEDELWDNLEMLRRCIIEGNVKGAKEIVFECEKSLNCLLLTSMLTTTCLQ